MKSLITIFILLTGIFSTSMLAQPWVYDFGTATGSFNTAGSTSGFLPDPPSGGGSDQVRVGNAGGGFVLSGGADSELQITASTGSSNSRINKFSVYDYTPGTSFSIGFNIRFECDSSDNGSAYFFIGDGDYFIDTTRWAYGLFTGVRWRKEAGNSFLSSGILNAAGGDYENINEDFSLNTEYYVEMFGNNTGLPTNYYYNGTQTLSAYSYDLWIDGTLTSVNNRLRSSGITIGNGAPIDSYMILAEGSTDNNLVVIVDDFKYSNQIDDVVLANLKVFLEGPYTGSTMSTALRDNGYLPLSQPYNTTPWNYTGTESVDSIPAGIVDWVLLELRSDFTTVVARRAAFIKSDGTIVDTDGSSRVTFTGVNDGLYYVVVRHRNHLAIMSASAILLNDISSLYNFSTSETKAYTTGTDPMIDFGGGVFGMYSGDTNTSGIITAADKTLVNSDNLSTGYYISDTNFSGIVTAADKTNINSNNLKQEFVP